MIRAPENEPQVRLKRRTAGECVPPLKDALPSKGRSLEQSGKIRHASQITDSHAFASSLELRRSPVPRVRLIPQTAVERPGSGSAARVIARRRSNRSNAVELRVMGIPLSGTEAGQTPAVAAWAKKPRIRPGGGKGQGRGSVH
jgi:hypothetical protein